jgi:multimeric flavodoxin WrbA
VQAADTLVLAVPMYNFGITALLKNWIDAIARAKVTFEYTEHGPRGLLTGKRVYVVLTRGGIYRDQPTDTVVPYLRTVLEFLGMTDRALHLRRRPGHGPGSRGPRPGPGPRADRDPAAGGGASASASAGRISRWSPDDRRQPRMIHPAALLDRHTKGPAS